VQIKGGRKMTRSKMKEKTTAEDKNKESEMANPHPLLSNPSKRALLGNFTFIPCQPIHTHPL
jgi:hypothetical protein